MMVRASLATALIILILTPSLSVLIPIVSEGQTDKGWTVGAEVKYVETAWHGDHNNTSIDDMAIMISYGLYYDGKPATGVIAIANITDMNGKRYWFKDGTNTLHDQIRYDGRDDSGKKVGEPIGDELNDGIYANLVAFGYVGTNRIWKFGNSARWDVELTFYRPGSPVYKTKNFIEFSDPGPNAVHWIDSIDLDTRTTGQDWAINAGPGQNMTASIVLNQTGHCYSKAGCRFRLSSWMTPYETSGTEFRIGEGNASRSGPETFLWNYTAPTKPGRYTITISETFADWWPLYNESVQFVGRLLVGSPASRPKVDLLAPTNGSEQITYQPKLSWSSSGFGPGTMKYMVMMDDVNGSTFDVAITDAQSLLVEVTGKRHQMWSVMAYNGFEWSSSEVWNFNIKGDPANDRAPTVSLGSPMNGFQSNSSALTFTWIGSDPDGDKLTYVFQVAYRSNKTIVSTRETSESTTELWLANGEYSWLVLPKDPWKTGICSNCDRWLTVKAVLNTQPVSTLISPKDGTLFVNQSVEFKWRGFDPQNDTLQFKLEVRDPVTGDLFVERYLFETNLTLWLPPWRYVWTVIPFDGDLWGWCSNGSWSLEVVGSLNRPPTVISRAPSSAYVGQGYRYLVVASDPDGDVITYTLMNGPANMSVDRKSGVVVWTPGPQDIGTRDISIVVMDGRGGRTVHNFRLYVSQDMGPVRTRSEDRVPFLALALVIIVISTVVVVVARLLHRYK